MFCLERYVTLSEITEDRLYLLYHTFIDVLAFIFVFNYFSTSKILKLNTAKLEATVIDSSLHNLLSSCS